MKNKLSLSIAIFVSTSFPSSLFAANIFDEQKEGFCYTQPINEARQLSEVSDYTVLINKKINHILDDIEEVEEDLEDNLLVVNQKLVTINDQSPPLLLGAVLQHEQNNELHQYLIANTGLLSQATQSDAVKKAHKKGFHLIQATPGHICLQLLQWLQVSKYYTVIALHSNRPVCCHCHLIANELWKKKLQRNEKGCFSAPFPLPDKIPTLAQQYINNHLSLSFVQRFVVPMMGYVSKEEMQKAIQQKNKQLDENKEQIEMLNREIDKKDNQIKEKSQIIASLKNLLEKEKKKLFSFPNRQSMDANTEQRWRKAVEQEGVDEVKKMLEMYNVDINVLDQYGYTALHYAAYANRVDVTKLLIDNGANVNIQDKNGGDTALHAVAEKNYVEVAKVLITAGINLNIQNKDNGDTALHAAISFNYVEVAKVLIAAGINLNIQDNHGGTALYIAAKKNHLEAVKLLVSNRANVDIPSKDGWTALHFAVFNNNVGITKLLVTNGAKLNIQDKNKCTALHWAANKSYVEVEIEILKLLISKKEDVNIQDKRGDTALHWAAKGNRVEVVKILIQKEANINMQDNNGDTALHKATSYGNVEAVKLLIAEGADVNIQNRSERTPLCQAAVMSYVEVAKLLVKAGASLNVRDNKKMTPLDVAKKRGHIGMINFLNKART